MKSFAAPGSGGDAGCGTVVSLGELIALGQRARANSFARGLRVAPPPGLHASIRRLRGMEFAEVRPYQPGDDARAIDWRQTARRGRIYTKLFHEERQRPVRLLVDLGPSMRFGTRVAFKSVVAARAAALLAWRAVAVGDRVGGLVWNGAGFTDLPPGGRPRGALKLLKVLADASAAPVPAVVPGASLAVPLNRLLRTPQPGGMTVLISDFHTLDAEAARLIAALAVAGELLLLHVFDVFESDPPAQRFRLSDGQRGLTLDLAAAATRDEYCAAFGKRRALLEQLARGASATLLPLATHVDLQAALPRAFSSGFRQ